jgi:hypothetical protein
LKISKLSNLSKLAILSILSILTNTHKYNMSDTDWTNQEMGPQSVMEEPDDLSDYYFTPVLPNRPVMEEPDDLSDYDFHPCAHQGCKKIAVLDLHHPPPLYWGTQQVDRRMRKDTMLKRNYGSFCHSCNEVFNTDTDDVCWVDNHDEAFCRECFASLITQGEIVVCQSCNENVWSDEADETNEFCEECAEETQ